MSPTASLLPLLLLSALLLTVNTHSSPDEHHSHITPLLTPLTTLPPSTAALTASALTSTATLSTLLLLPLNPTHNTHLLPYAAGALLADLFLHLLPSLYSPPTPSTTPSLLLGLLLFFILDTLTRYTQNSSPAAMNLTADALHNFCDGLSIAAAFTASPSAGVATTLAVLLHELPQELADFAVLLRAGYSKPQAIVANFICALTALFGTYVALKAAESFRDAHDFLTAFAAGGMLYMTFAAVIPDVVADVAGTCHHHGTRGGNDSRHMLAFVKRLLGAIFGAAMGVFTVAIVEELH